MERVHIKCKELDTCFFFKSLGKPKYFRLSARQRLRLDEELWDHNCMTQISRNLGGVSTPVFRTHPLLGPDKLAHNEHLCSHSKCLFSLVYFLIELSQCYISPHICTPSDTITLLINMLGSSIQLVKNAIFSKRSFYP